MTREVKKDLQDRISYDQRFRRCIMYKSAIFACFRIRISNNDPIRTRFRSCVKKVNFDKFELENRFHIVLEPRMFTKSQILVLRCLSLTTGSLSKTFYDRLMSKVTRAVIRGP